MHLAYFDCFSGVSGDMCLGALVDAGLALQHLRETLRTLPLEGYSLEAEKVRRAGVAATRVKVLLQQDEHQPARGLEAVLEVMRGGELPEAVEEKAAEVFRALAQAEARVHDTDPQSVHFHEVGAVDAICDIVGTVAGLHELGVERVLFSPVALGGGTVDAAHGTLPVPAPATAELLRGMPTYGGPIDRELATPTGAALLTALGEPASHWPRMRVGAIGYGAGGSDPEEVPNVLRLAIGEAGGGASAESDVVWCLEANLDDITGEEAARCSEKLLEAGALDSFTTPIQMKKGRPGLKLAALCGPADLRRVEGVFWRHSTTLGVRRSLMQRSRLRRRVEKAETPWGEVRLKVAFLGEQQVRREPEYEDCRRIAEREGLALREVYRAALRGGGQ